MTDGMSPKDSFSKVLLADAAPEEAPLYSTYADALAQNNSSRPVGVGLGIPPEMLGAIGIAAVAVGHMVYGVLLSWAKDVGEEVLEKYLVEKGLEKLKGWLDRPVETDLSKTLTAERKLAILAVVEQEASQANLSDDDTKKLKALVLERLGV